MAIGCQRRGFGRAPGRHHRQRAADRLDREVFYRIPEILRQRRGGIEYELHFAEEAAAQFVIAAQCRYQHVEAAGHVQIHRWHHAAQIGQRRREQARRRLAAVDVQCAAVAQHQIEIVIGAEGVAPRQPVEDHQIASPIFEKRPGLRLGLLVRCQHALCIDDRLRRAGRTRGEQKFCNSVRCDGREGFCDRRCFRCRGDRSK